ncbi:MAG TPA: hypothetical protein VFL34_09060 [Candidatus Sulfotelmatobacter sp.]|nr:hypothetical protein [Candidatus Sulfotelmatobacter sp.]
MGNNARENYQPSCILAHNLINKLTTILGACELLKDKAEDDVECMRRLLTIQETAKSIATELTQHQCHLDAAARAELMERTVEISEPQA